MLIRKKKLTITNTDTKIKETFLNKSISYNKKEGKIS